MVALVLTIGSVQARLGWTLDECENAWGNPVYAGNSGLGLPNYWFKVQSNLWASVILLNGKVHSIGYYSKSGKFLVKNLNQLLTKNLDTTWYVYDDGRGKETWGTWHVLADDGSLIAYAIIWNYPDKNGFYSLTLGTGLWNNYLDSHGTNRNVVNDDSNNINI